MKHELTNPLGRVFITIEEDKENRWIHVVWMGYLTAENIKAGATAYIEALSKEKFNCVLNDTRLVIGPWDHSMDWIIDVWSHAAAKAGLEHFAMIVSPETMAEASAANFTNHLTAFEAQLFEDLQSAQKWLRQFSLIKY